MEDIDINELFPEDECVRNGDPFLARMAEWDDYIGDCENNVEWMGWSKAKSEAEIARAVWQQRSYAVTLLFRWYDLPASPTKESERET